MNNLFAKSKLRIFKIATIFFSILLMIFAVSYYINYRYVLIRDNFYSEFNKCNFNEAKNIINEDNFYININKKSLNNDLNEYFSSIVGTLCNDILTNKVNKDDALKVFKEIKDYNILNSSLDKLIVSLDEGYVPNSDSDYESLLELGMESYNNNAFESAINILRKIPDSSTNYYSSASDYINKCISGYKNQLFSQADTLSADDYYTKAIELLSNVDTSIVSDGADDADIKAKILSIKDSRESYLASISENGSENSTSTSNLLLQSISSSNINTLNIESLTSSLIHVSLADQVTYVYNGSMNDWKLAKSFSCSTGIESEKTPTGIYDIRERGEWFFSENYGQGGKYWVQFLGDYLFHSIPYNEDQSQVLDYTLGTPASHGCIRLKTEDAKWIYDNIKSGTKVIIN